MTPTASAQTAAVPARRPAGLQGIVADWSSDQRAFKNVSWGKAMMWIFLLSDTFVSAASCSPT
jgi:cytochrome c oxidase subunit III